jgi:hypothetical protein
VGEVRQPESSRAGTLSQGACAKIPAHAAVDAVRLTQYPLPCANRQFQRFVADCRDSDREQQKSDPRRPPQHLGRVGPLNPDAMLNRRIT